MFGCHGVRVQEDAQDVGLLTDQRQGTSPTNTSLQHKKPPTEPTKFDDAHDVLPNPVVCYFGGGEQHSHPNREIASEPLTAVRRPTPPSTEASPQRRPVTAANPSHVRAVLSLERACCLFGNAVEEH